jgi:DTW domain-containing protein YfiP
MVVTTTTVFPFWRMQRHARLVVVVVMALCRMNLLVQARPSSTSRALLWGLMTPSTSSLSSTSSDGRFHGGDCGRQRGGWNREGRGATSSRRNMDSRRFTTLSSNNNDYSNSNNNDDRSFLGEIEATVARVLSELDGMNTANTTTNASTSTNTINIQDVDAPARQAVGVARHLQRRIRAAQRNNDCPTCWLQRAHCICSDCPAIIDNSEHDNDNSAHDNGSEHNGLKVARLRRLFLVYHHKEICLAVDTAKLLASTLPKSQVRVVVGGIPAVFQDSMKELEEALCQPSGSCLVLYPDETARTWQEFQEQEQEKHANSAKSKSNDANNQHPHDTETESAYDVIVLDGTWEQARKLYRRYIPDEASGGPLRIQLEPQALDRIVSGSHDDCNATSTTSASIPASTGRQLRRHPVLWREIATTAATRCLLQDMDPDGPWEEVLATYQQRADAAARAQLGAPRISARRTKK